MGGLYVCGHVVGHVSTHVEGHVKKNKLVSRGRKHEKEHVNKMMEQVSPKLYQKGKTPKTKNQRRKTKEQTNKEKREMEK